MSPRRTASPARWIALAAAAVLAGVGLAVVVLAVTGPDDGPGDTTPSSQAGTGRSPLGCDVVADTGDPRVTFIVPRECTYVGLGRLFCGAREPIEFLGTGGDFGGRGMRGQTVDNFRDARGRPFQWIITSAGEPASVTSRLLCNDDGRVLPVDGDEMRTLIRVGDELPPSLLAKIGSGGSREPGAPAGPPPTATPSRTGAGGGGPSACRAELERLLRDVVSGRSTRDEAEAEIPDAARTVALREAVDAVARYRQDGLTEDESVAEAGAAFLYPCGER